MRKFNEGKKFGRRFHKDRRVGGTGGNVVELREGESAESLIRRFKKVVEFSGVLQQLKKKEFHMSKSQKRRDKRARAAKRARKESRRQTRPMDRE